MHEVLNISTQILQKLASFKQPPKRITCRLIARPNDDCCFVNSGEYKEEKKLDLEKRSQNGKGKKSEAEKEERERAHLSRIQGFKTRKSLHQSFQAFPNHHTYRHCTPDEPVIHPTMLFSLYNAPFIALGLLIAYYLVPYVQSWHKRSIPSPGLAAFTNLWLLLQARQGKRYLSVDEAHKKYGKVVRIAPNHVSIADDAAIQAIYGHGNGFLKA